MDLPLIALIGMVVLAVAGSTRRDIRLRARPGYLYHLVFSAAAGGLLLFVSGLAGWDLSHSRGWFQGAKWVASPIWWQVTLGSMLLAIAAFVARRVPTAKARQ